MKKQKIRARQRAREMAVQAIYQRFVADQAMSAVEAQFRTIIKPDKVDVEYFADLIQGVEKNCSVIDMEFTPYLDRKLSELNPVERSILRLSSYEMLFCLEIPFKIIIEEAILLAKTFGAQDSYKYINGVLNQLANKIRLQEKSES